MSTSAILSERAMPTRGAALKATASFAEQLLSSPGRSDDEPSSDSFGEPIGRKSGVKYRYGGKGKFRASPLKLSVSPEHPSKKRKPAAQPVTAAPRLKVATSKKRKASAAISEKDTMSSLSTLSPSPLSTAPPSPIVQFKSLPPSSKSVEMSPQSPSLASRSSRVPKSSKSKPSGSNGFLNVTPSKPLFDTSPGKSSREEPWSLKTLGDFVWVLVNESGIIIDDGDLQGDGIELEEERMWWPARVTHKSTPFRVSLYGELPSGAKGSLSINSPSRHNLLPLHTKKGTKRFTLSTFRTTSLPTSPSAHKRHKSELSHKWQAAVEDMTMAAEDEEEGLPDLLSTYTGSFCDPPETASDGNTRARSRAKGKSKMVDEDLSMSPERSWSPPPQDTTLQIPGELVLALAPRSTKCWPAMLIEYVPPTKPKQKAKYKVKFLDDEEYILPREKFFVFDQPEFVTCELGQFESAVKDDDDDNDEEQETIPIDRGPSPLPVLPLSRDFSDLNMHEQLAYVKPVLHALLQGTYAPAKARHDQFFKGGAARASLQKDAAVRGGLSPAEIKHLQAHLSEWALRQERFAKRMEEDAPQIATQMSESYADEGDAEGPLSAPLSDVRDLLQTAVNDTEQSTELSPPPESNDVPVEGEFSTDPSPSRVVEETPGQVEEVRTMGASREPQAEGHESAEPDCTALPPGPEVSGPPRQRGCQEYEALSGVEKLDYCVNVLLPEAVQQILLWRSGDRTSVELLSPEEEQTLHDIGVRKGNETDWVFDVLRMREAQARIIQNKSTSSAVVLPPGTSTPTGGTRSRPRRGTVTSAR